MKPRRRAAVPLPAAWGPVPDRYPERRAAEMKKAQADELRAVVESLQMEIGF
jgi:hypothetical protein